MNSCYVMIPDVLCYDACWQVLVYIGFTLHPSPSSEHPAASTSTGQARPGSAAAVVGTLRRVYREYGTT